MKVSVIVPVYNAEPYLERCVKSLLAQTYDELELIFVNDCSTDGSLDMLRQLLDGTTRDVTILDNEHNMGCSASRRVGMKVATGDYIVNIDSDDYVDPRYVELLALKAAQCDSDVVICDMTYDYGDKQEVRHVEPVDDHFEVMSRMLSGVMHSCWWNKLIKRSLIVEHDLYPIPQVTLGEDKVVTVKVMYYASRVDFVPQALYFYNRTNDTSMLSQSKARAVSQWMTVTRYISDFFADKTLDARCVKALQHHKALVLGHVALYGTSDDLRQYHSQLDVTVGDIASHPMAPMHYKIAAMAHVCGLHFIVTSIRVLMRLLRRR